MSNNEKYKAFFDSLFKCFCTKNILGLSVSLLGLPLIGLHFLKYYIIANLRNEVTIGIKKYVFDAFYELSSDVNNLASNVKHYLIIEYEETKSSKAIRRFVHYINQVFNDDFKSFKNEFTLDFVIIYGPLVKAGKDIFDFGCVRFYIVYLSNYTKDVLTKIFDDKIANGINATPLEILALSMLPRHEKDFSFHENMLDSELEFNKTVLKDCLHYAFNKILLTVTQQIDLYLRLKDMYYSHVPSDFWEEIERSNSVMDKYELRDEELRREAVDRALAELANELLDDGMPRDFILKKVAKNDDNWLKKIEAARENRKAS